MNGCCGYSGIPTCGGAAGYISGGWGTVKPGGGGTGKGKAGSGGNEVGTFGTLESSPLLLLGASLQMIGFSTLVESSFCACACACSSCASRCLRNCLVLNSWNDTPPGFNGSSSVAGSTAATGAALKYLCANATLAELLRVGSRTLVR